MCLFLLYNVEKIGHVTWLTKRTAENMECFLSVMAKRKHIRKEFHSDCSPFRKKFLFTAAAEMCEGISVRPRKQVTHAP